MGGVSDRFGLRLVDLVFGRILIRRIPLRFNYYRVWFSMQQRVVFSFADITYFLRTKIISWMLEKK